MDARVSHTNGAQAGLPQGSQPGVVVFSPTGRLLHINEPALVALRVVEGCSIRSEGPIDASSLPPLVLDLQRDIVARIEQRAEAGDLALFEVKRVVRIAGCKVMLRGFGVPDHRSPKQSRVIITMHETPADCEMIEALPLAPTGT